MTDLAPTIAALRRARDSLLYGWHPEVPPLMAADAALLEALAKALEDLTSEEFWNGNFLIAEQIRERLERAP